MPLPEAVLSGQGSASQGPTAEPHIAPRPAPVVAATDAAATADGSPIVDDGSVPDGIPADAAVANVAVTLFSDLGLSEPILRAVAEMGYVHPTPIQVEAIPVVLAGRDVLGVAQTGTGKTAGFTLPMLDILTGSRSRARMPRSLILEPTRELALQVAENFVKYGKYLKLNHALLIGGESLTDQKNALMKGVDVLIATPGRLLDLFERGGMMLTDTRILVIDEADRMLDMGFIPDVEKIVSFLPANRQTLFFSATMAGEIRRLADAFLSNPRQITVSRAASLAPLITAGLAVVAETDKRDTLRRIIRHENVTNALIFCNRKRDVDVLSKSLTKHGFSAGALHGDLAQSVRFATLERFKAGEIRLLVCSDVAARGIDIGGLSHVFNFDVPHHSEDYVHRIGRTGRAGLTGHAYTIAAPADRANVEAIEHLTGHPIPRMSVDGVEPLDWEESDGKRGRGRRGAAAPQPAMPAPSIAIAAPSEAGADNKPGRRRRGRGGADRSDRPRSDASAADLPPASEAAATLPVPEPVRSARGDDRSRSRDDGPRGDSRARDDRARDAERGFRRDRGRRDDDLGPAVLGFGADVPPFMLLPTRAVHLHASARPPRNAPDASPAIDAARSGSAGTAVAPSAAPLPIRAEPPAAIDIAIGARPPEPLPEPALEPEVAPDGLSYAFVIDELPMPVAEQILPAPAKPKRKSAAPRDPAAVRKPAAPRKSRAKAKPAADAAAEPGSDAAAGRGAASVDLAPVAGPGDVAPVQAMPAEAAPDGSKADPEPPEAASSNPAAPDTPTG